MRSRVWLLTLLRLTVLLVQAVAAASAAMLSIGSPSLSPPPPMLMPANQTTRTPPNFDESSMVSSSPLSPFPDVTPPLPTQLLDWTTLLPSYSVYTADVYGGNLKIKFGSDNLIIECQMNASLDGRLPRLQPPRRDRAVTVGCAPPAAGYRRALARLGVELAPDALLALDLPQGGQPLAAAHLTDLYFTNLTLSAAVRADRAPPVPSADLLRGRRLLRLEIRYVPLAARMLDALEPPLRTLVLDRTSEVRVPSVLCASIEFLVARRTSVRLEGEASNLREMSLDLPPGRAEPPALAGLPVLSTLSVTNWRSKEPRPLVDCGSLKTLTLTKPTFEKLPARWVAACGALRSLAVHSAKRLESLPKELLEGASGLTWLELRSGVLSSMPDRVFDPVPNLLHLDLTNNNLTMLPTLVFTGLMRLEELNLSKNKLNATVLRAVEKLSALRVLSLAHNEPLGDSCSGGRSLSNNGVSPLSSLKELTRLDLSYTGVTRICRDWRVGMPRLRELSLRKTKITTLKYEDFQYTRLVETLTPFVDLIGANVTTVEYSAEDERLAATAPPAVVELRLSSDLLCDCNTARAARAFRTYTQHARLVRSRSQVMCQAAPDLTPASGSLDGVQLDDMLCNFTLPEWESGRPAGCRAWEREETGPWRHRVRLECTAAGLVRLPPSLHSMQNANVSWDLRLSRNNISSLEGLPAGALELDLRNNTIEHLAAAHVVALTAADVKVLRLAGNPLDCGCSPEAAPLLRAAAGGALRAALDTALCRDGRLLAQAADERSVTCRPPPAATAGRVALLAALGALVPLALAAVVISAVLSRPAHRARFKAMLLRWGWLPRPAECDDGRRYDAFVSYAHEDEPFALRVAERLEAGPRPLRLCLHSRDWPPGEFIGAQIAASVRDSRRTLVLVSRAFLRSQWARAEFREAAGAAARDAGPRLVLVLLEEPSALPLDRELRHYVTTNTYLLAAHPRFWDRLRDAMPPPRTPDAPPPPASDHAEHPVAEKAAPTAGPLAIVAPNTLIPVAAQNAKSWSPNIAQIAFDDKQNVCQLSKESSSGYGSSCSSSHSECPSPPWVPAVAPPAPPCALPMPA